MHRRVTAAIERALDAKVVRASAVRGGDINEAWCIETSDGRRVFVKTSPSADRWKSARPHRDHTGARSARTEGSGACEPMDDPHMFESEARGLEWLAEGPLRVPRVLASNEPSRADEPSFLALEWIDRGPPARGADDALGRGLAQLHRMGAPSFGLAIDNFLGTIPQDNTPAPDWPTFYGQRRLEPLLRRAVAREASTRRIEHGIERVIAELPSLCGPSEPPSRLHGDLWGGNVMHDEHGAPVLIDPACYGGQRETDLAMMQLFGGFSPAVLEAYAAEFPLAAGHEARVPLYQLLPLLAHAVLFGATWIGAIEAALDRIER